MLYVSRCSISKLSSLLSTMITCACPVLRYAITPITLVFKGCGETLLIFFLRDPFTMHCVHFFGNLFNPTMPIIVKHLHIKLHLNLGCMGEWRKEVIRIIYLKNATNTTPLERLIHTSFCYNIWNYISFYAYNFTKVRVGYKPLCGSTSGSNMVAILLYACMLSSMVGCYHLATSNTGTTRIFLQPIIVLKYNVMLVLMLVYYATNPIYIHLFVRLL